MKNFNWRCVLADLKCNLIRSIFCVFAIIFVLSLQSTILGQTPWHFSVSVPPTHQVPQDNYGHVGAGTYEDSPAFSPSITSFSSAGAEYLVAAYVYRYDQAHRTVGFSRSTDGGETWNVIHDASYPTHVFTLHPPVSPTFGWTMTNMDDPKIISIGGQTLVCVVRAWSDEAGYYTGSPVQEQPGSIYTSAGIYEYISTNAGATWGYWSGSSLDTSAYGVVDAVDADATSLTTSGSNTNTTLEFPNIAFRVGFSSLGYITWQKRTWTNTSTGIRVSSSSVGIRAFMNASNAGEMYASSGSYYDQFGLHSSPTQGPERPSVAIGPDQSLWLSYYAVHYDQASGGSATQTANGQYSPYADYYLRRGSCTIASSVATFSFTSDQLRLNAYSVPVAGIYDANRGYLYGVDTCYHDLTGGATGIDDTDIVDYATGPSVQVADENPPSAAIPIT